MKKILLGAAALSLLFAASCKKSDDGGSSIGSWKLNGTTYNATETDSTASGSSYSLYVNDASGNGVTFTFNNTPATGTYKVVSFASLFLTSSNAVCVQTLTLPSNAYASTGNDNINSSVTVNNGKVAITVPSVWMKNMNGSDTVQLTATITQH